MKAEITVNAMGTGSLALDGQDVSKGISGFTLRADVGRVTHLVLDVLLLDRSRVDVDEPEIEVPEATHDLLVFLGWTPPTVSPSGSGTPPS